MSDSKNKAWSELREQLGDCAAYAIHKYIRAVIAENAAPRTATAEPWEPTDEQIREALAATRQAKHWIRAYAWWAGFTSVGDQYPIEFFYPHSARQIALEYLSRRPR